MPQEKILIRGVNWLGDAVMTTPALHSLRSARPAAWIGLLTPAGLADLWRHHPAIDATLTFASGESPWKVARRLRQEQFNLAIVLPNSPRSALETWLAGIPKRIGYARPWRSWLLTHPVAPRPGEHAMHKRSAHEIRQLISQPATGQSKPVLDQAHHVFQYLHLIASLNINTPPAAPKLWVLDEEVQEMRDHLGQAFRSAPFWLGLNPGAEYGPAKRWPKAFFVETAAALHGQTGCGWILFGGAKDVALVNEIAQALANACPSPLINLAGQTTLRQLCAAMKLCRVFLTNDTGPMHVAAAVGTPVAALFGSTSPELTRPGHPLEQDQRHAILQSGPACSPCFLRECPIDFRCMQNLRPSQVTASVLNLLRLCPTTGH